MKLFNLWSLLFVLVIIGGRSKAGFLKKLLRETERVANQAIHFPTKVVRTVVPGKLGRELGRITDQVAPVVIAAMTGGTASAVVAGVSQAAKIAKVKNVEKITSLVGVAVNIGSVSSLSEFAKAAAKEGVMRADDINKKVLNGKLGDLRWLQAVGTAAITAGQKGGDFGEILKETGQKVATDNLDLITDKLLGGHESDLARLTRIAFSTKSVLDAPTSKQRVAVASEILAQHVDGLREVVKIANSAGSVLEAAKTGSRQVIADAIFTMASQNIKGMDEALRIAGIVRDVASNSADRSKIMESLAKETLQKLKLNELNCIVDVVVNASLVEKSRGYLADALLRESGKVMNELGDLAKIVDAVQIAVSNKSKEALMEALFSEVASKVDPDLAKLVETVQTIATKNLTREHLISEAARQLNRLVIVSKISSAVGDAVNVLNETSSTLISNFEEKLATIDGFSGEMIAVLITFRNSSLDEPLLLEAARLVGHREVVSITAEAIKDVASTQVDNDLGAVLMAETARLLSGRPEFIEIAEAIRTSVTGDVRQNIEATLLCDTAKLAVLRSNNSLQGAISWLDAQDNLLATMLISDAARKQAFKKANLSHFIASSLLARANELVVDGEYSEVFCFNGTENCSKAADVDIAGIFMSNLTRQFDPSAVQNATLVEDVLSHKITSDFVEAVRAQLTAYDRPSAYVRLTTDLRNQLAADFVGEAIRLLAGSFNSSTVMLSKQRQIYNLQPTERNGEAGLLQMAVDKVNDTLSPRNLSRVRRAIEKASRFDDKTLQLLKVSWKTLGGTEDAVVVRPAKDLSVNTFVAIFVPIFAVLLGSTVLFIVLVKKRRLLRASGVETEGSRLFRRGRSYSSL